MVLNYMSHNIRIEQSFKIIIDLQFIMINYHEVYTVQHL